MTDEEAGRLDELQARILRREFLSEEEIFEYCKALDHWSESLDLVSSEVIRRALRRYRA